MHLYRDVSIEKEQIRSVIPTSQEASMPFIDFAAVKAAAPIEDVAKLLRLDVAKSGQQLRGVCPACKSSDKRGLAITPSKGLWYCFASTKGGDAIALVAHMKGVEMKDAAQFLAEQYGISTGTVQGTVRKERANEPPAHDRAQEEGLKPLDYLEADHPAVEAVGFDSQTAQALGIGYAPKGIMRGTVAVPIRDERGVLTGYIGVTEARLPSSFRIGGVVALKTA